jgi:hypothetical protein
MTFFDHSKSIVENIYLLSGPFLLIVSAFGLKQLKIAKDNIKINSKRQAITLSFDLCEKYERSLEEKCQIIERKMQELGINPNEIIQLNPSKLNHFTSEIISNNEFKKTIENYDKLSKPLTDLANELEGFSIAFVKGIADEELAYDLQFTQFYHWSVMCLTEIYMTKNLNNKPVEQILYSNLCEIYSIWKLRNEKEIIGRQVANLIKKESEIDSKTIIPIGAN